MWLTGAMTETTAPEATRYVHLVSTTEGRTFLPYPGGYPTGGAQAARVHADANRVNGWKVDVRRVSEPCICLPPPVSDGPDEFCPVHGRTYDELLAMLDSTQRQLQALQPLAPVNSTQVSRCGCSDEALIAELRARGYGVLGESTKRRAEEGSCSSQS